MKPRIEIDDVGTGHGLATIGLGILIDQDFRFYKMSDVKEIPPITARLLVEELKLHQVPIRLCQGNVLDPLAKVLKGLGFPVERVRIEGMLQEKLDAAYQECLSKEGLPEKLLVNLFNYFRFPADLFAWCAINPKERFRFLNTIPPRRGFRITYTTKGQASSCFECGKTIKRSERRIQLEVTSAKGPMNRREVHTGCMTALR